MYFFLQFCWKMFIIITLNYKIINHVVYVLVSVFSSFDQLNLSSDIRFFGGIISFIINATISWLLACAWISCRWPPYGQYRTVCPVDTESGSNWLSILLTCRNRELPKIKPVWYWTFKMNIPNCGMHNPSDIKIFVVVSIGRANKW